MGHDLTSIFERAQSHVAKALRNEEELLMGQISGAKTGIIERGNGLSLEAKKKLERQKAEREKLTQFLTSETLKDYLIKLEREIQAMEAEFRKRDGDEWREKLALRILSADDIPQRETHESIEEYRKRIELLLIDEMLSHDGSIKAKYLDDPELSDYAQWAQKQNNFNRAQTYVQKFDNQDDIRLDQIQDRELLVFIDLRFGEDNNEIKNEIDEQDRTLGNSTQNSARNSFFAPND